MEQIAPTIARHVQSLLNTRRISLREASRKTGIPHSTLDRRLRGITPFDIDELDRLADLLGTDVATLFADATTGTAA